MKKIITVTFILISSSIIYINNKDIQDSKQKFVIQWDALNQNEYIKNAIFSPNGKYIIYTEGKNIGIRLSDGTILDKVFINEDDNINDIKFSPNGQYFAASVKNKIYVWRLSDREMQYTISPMVVTILYNDTDTDSYKTKPLKVNSFIFTKDSKYIISGSSTGVISLWEFHSGNIIIETKTGLGDVKLYQYNGKDNYFWCLSNNKLYKIPFSPTNKAIGTEEKYKPYIDNVSANITRFIEIINNSLYNEEAIKSISSSKEVEYSSDRKFATISYNEERSNHIHISDNNGKNISVINMDWDEYANSINFSPDGQYLLAAIEDDIYDLSGRRSNSLQIFETATGKLISKYQISDAKRNSVSSDERAIVTVSNDIISVWLLYENKYLWIENLSEMPVDMVWFSPDGKYIAGISKPYPEGSGTTTLLYRTKDLKLMTSVGVMYGDIGTYFSNSSKYMLVPDYYGIISIFETESGKLLYKSGETTYSPMATAISHNDKFLATATCTESSNELNLLQLHDGTLLKKKTLEYCPYKIKFSNNDEVIVTTDYNYNEVYVWNIENNNCFKMISTPENDYYTVDIVISDNNKYAGVIKSKSQPDKISIWDLNAKKHIKTLDIVNINIGISTEGDIYEKNYPVNKYITTTFEGTTKIVRTTDSKSLLLYSFKDGNWLVYDHETNEFDGSKGAIKYIKIVNQLKIKDFYKFYKKYYSPGLLSKLIS